MITREKMVDLLVRMTHAVDKASEIKKETDKFAVENEQEIKSLLEKGDEELEKLYEKLQESLRVIESIFIK